MTLPDWDVLVVGGGPAGLAAARSAASLGARVAVLERASHPRYKVCGGGLLGWSLSGLDDPPARDAVTAATFTLGGRYSFTRHAARPFVTMVMRSEFDLALRDAAIAAGAAVLEGCQVRAVRQSGAYAAAVLADGRELTAGALIGADGSAGVVAAHVGVRYAQVDLGLERELTAVDPASWRGRLLLDWGPLPGSYGWVFPKDGVLTVGVIAARGDGGATKAYLEDFVRRLGLAGAPVVRAGGHLTKCRAPDSPLLAGRVLVAGDAAGLLEPWTREGISYALRSGAAAGRAAVLGPARYPELIAPLLAEMRTGARLYAAFRRHPGLFHAMLATPLGWRAFQRFCRGEAGFATALDRVPAPLRALGRAAVR